jgi:recombination protein RecA
VGKLRYGYGYDNEAELVNIAMDLGLVRKAGSWLTYGEEKFQGTENMRNYLIENPPVYEALNTQIREMLGLPL